MDNKKKVLERIAREYYPKGMSPMQEDYMKNREILSLQEKVSNIPSFWEKYISKMDAIPNIFIMDSSAPSIESPALLCDTYLHTSRFNYKLRFSFSLLIPYYYYKIEKHEVAHILPTENEISFFIKLSPSNRKTLRPSRTFQMDEFYLRKIAENIKLYGHLYDLTVSEFENNSYIKKIAARISDGPKEKFLNDYPEELEEMVALIQSVQKESIGYKEFPTALLSESLDDIRTPTNPDSPNTFKEIFWGNV